MNSHAWNEAPSTDDLRKSYDEIPYPNVPKPFTHISRLAAIAKIRGLNPTATVCCRVLEIGCADGGNLVPLAARFPASQFLGIDLSPQQIAIGRQQVAELELRNFELRTADIMQLRADDLGQFDYIIAHGIFSWVPAPVRDRILTVCRDHLSPSGIAYISYNTYPGWRGKQALREMLRYHTRSISDLRKKVESALEMLSILPEPSPESDEPAIFQAQRLRRDLERVDDPVTYLLHEYLVDVNEPLYFSEFVQLAEAAGLQYVDDAYPGSSSLDRLADRAREWVVRQTPNYLQQQQYVDLLGNVAFRRSLLCHARAVPRRDFTIDRLAGLHVAALCSRTESESNSPSFQTDAGRKFSTDHAGLRAVLECLADSRPSTVPFTELHSMLGGQTSAEDAASIFAGLLHGGAIEFLFDPLRCAQAISDRPKTPRLVRHQVAQGLVTNALHRSIRIENAFERMLIGLLDGSRSIAELTAELRKRLSASQPLSDAEWESHLRDHLSVMIGQGLLECDEDR
jgi:SAM-dependent methyltransferase